MLQLQKNTFHNFILVAANKSEEQADSLDCAALASDLLRWLRCRGAIVQDQIRTEMSFSTINEKVLAIISEAEINSWETLDLSGYDLTNIPPEIGQLNSLISLDISENNIDSFPDEFWNLKNLIKLDAYDNNIQVLPKNISKLLNLKSLHLDNNKLSELPIEIGELTKLRTLNLYGNEISELPREISKLRELRKLDLENNSLSTIPPKLNNLTKLTRLALANNFIIELPQELFQLDLNIFWGGEKGIIVDNNPLQVPPIELVRRGVYAVREYYKEIAKDETTRLYETKILIVGQGGVGKSYLMNRLVHDKIPEDLATTEGIDIQKWKFETKQTSDFNVNIWDFGGQEIYHATHQFFLTKRSLYLFVWEARSDADLLSFDYWLNTIKILSNNSPVIIIQNKIDERKKSINQEGWKKKFTNIIEYHNVSAVDGSGINELKNAIVSNVENMPHIGDLLPKRWINIREELENIEKNFIPYSVYKDICIKYGMSNEQTTLLSEYFHDLGVFLNFNENPILKNTIFLKPEWATNAVYMVVDNYNVIDSNGKFTFSDLTDIWRDTEEFPPEKFIELIELMKSFELCFEIQNKKTYIIPELLPGRQPSFQWDYNDSLWFKYKYDFMPAGIMTRLIVSVHDLIKDNMYWKDGVILEWENTIALIAKTTTRTIEVWINGDDRKNILSIIRRHMHILNSPFSNLEVNEMVRCICNECASCTSNPHFYPYKILTKAKDKRVTSIQCQKSFENTDIDSLLGNISHKINSGNKIRNIKIFLASSSELKEERDQIELLIGKENRTLIKHNIFLELVIWEDLKLSFHGSRIQDYFNNKMLECHIVICMFHKTVGDFTLEEFNVAFESFSANQKPYYFYTYFKNDRTGEQITETKCIRDMKKRIQQEKQIYCTFSSNPDLKLQLKDQLVHILNEVNNEI